MCICICMYMHVQSCTYVKKINLYCICKCVYMEMSTYAHICTLYKYVYLCMYMFACVHVYLPVFLHLGSLTESYSVYSKPFVVSRCQSWYNDAQYVYIYICIMHTHMNTHEHTVFKQKKESVCLRRRSPDAKEQHQAVLQWESLLIHLRSVACLISFQILSHVQQIAAVHPHNKMSCIEVTCHKMYCTPHMYDIIISWSNEKLALLSLGKIRGCV